VGDEEVFAAILIKSFSQCKKYKLYMTRQSSSSSSSSSSSLLFFSRARESSPGSNTRRPLAQNKVSGRILHPFSDMHLFFNNRPKTEPQNAEHTHTHAHRHTRTHAQREREREKERKKERKKERRLRWARRCNS